MRPVRFLVAALMLCVFVAANDRPGTMSLSVPDVVLRDQDGDRVRVYSQLIAGQVVVMNFIFTSCTTICSPMGANFGELQKHVGPGVRLISISIDPVTDTPARLKRWGSQFHAGPSWRLLTGENADVERLLKAMGVYTPNRFEHAPIMLVGDGVSGRWIRTSGLAAPGDVVELIHRLRASDQPSGKVTRR
jgi:protein SCO1/2